MIFQTKKCQINWPWLGVLAYRILIWYKIGIRENNGSKGWFRSELFVCLFFLKFAIASFE